MGNPNQDGSLDLRLICTYVMNEGIPCFVDHVLAGSLMLYAGSKGEGRNYPVGAGPGRYYGEPKRAIGFTHSFYIAPGDQPPGPSWWTCPLDATETDVANEIIRQVRAATPVVAPPVKTWPETDAERDAFVDWQYHVGEGDTLRGFRDWFNMEHEEGMHPDEPHQSA